MAGSVVNLNDVAEVAPALGATWRPGDAWLGGGTWLFSRAQPGTRRLLDLHYFGWPPHECGPGGISIAATCTIGRLLELAPTPEWPGLRLVQQCADAFSGSFKIRDFATVGGNLAVSLPIGPMIALVTALDGVCRLESAGRSRSVRSGEFVTGVGTNVLEAGELIRSVFLPAPALRDRVAFRRVSLTRHGPSAVVVIGRSAPGRGCTLAITAATTRPLQLVFPDVPALNDAAARLVRAEASYVHDCHGSARWREHMTAGLVAEVIRELAR
jgi:CO/xanthine dehydrogenase FAD-binding subunit